jgi:hypothetical protein
MPNESGAAPVNDDDDDLDACDEVTNKIEALLEGFKVGEALFIMSTLIADQAKSKRELHIFLGALAQAAEVQFDFEHNEKPKSVKLQ